MKNTDFMGKRKTLFLISFIIALIASIIIIAVKPNRDTEFTGSREYVFTYAKELAEGEISPAGFLSYDGRPAPSEEPKTVPLDMELITEVLSERGISPKEIIDNPGEKFTSTAYLTVVIGDLYSSPEGESYDDIIPSAMASLNYPVSEETGEVDEEAHDPNFEFQSKIMTEPIFSKNLMVSVSVAVLISFVFVLVALAFGLTALGGLGVAFVIITTMFFADVVTMASYFVLKIPMGMNFVWVMFGVSLLTVFVCSTLFKKVQNDYFSITPKT